MQYLKQSSDILRQSCISKHVELCGRNCYKSEDRITDESSVKFIENVSRMGHGSVMEHGAIYLKVDNKMNNLWEKQLIKVGKSKYSYMKYDNGFKYIYTNLRVVFENAKDFYDIIINNRELPEGVTYFSPEDYDPFRRVTVRIITDRRIETEIVRHRLASFSIESTRYVNYSKKGMSFIDIRPWLKNRRRKFWWWCATKCASFFYNRLKGKGTRPEIEMARSVLLSCNKADIVMTAFVKDWEHFFELRTSKASHPQIREIADDLKIKFKFANYID